MYAFDKLEQDLYNIGYARDYYSISDKYDSPDEVRFMYEFYLALMIDYCKEKAVDSAGRASYIERNQWMIDDSDCCVFLSTKTQNTKAEH